jgi:hypothetical protein
VSGATPELQTALSTSSARLVRADPGFALAGFESLAGYLPWLPLPTPSALDEAAKAIDELARSARNGGWTTPDVGMNLRAFGGEPDSIELRVERVRRDVAWARVCVLPAESRAPGVARGVVGARRCVELSAEGPPRSRTEDRGELLRFLLEADRTDEAAGQDPGELGDLSTSSTALRAEVLRRRGNAEGARAIYGAHGYRRTDDEAELALIEADLGNLGAARESLERHRGVEENGWIGLTCLRKESVRAYIEAKGKPK